MVVPKPVRDALQLSPGAELSVELGDGCFVVRRKDNIRPTTLDDVVGMFKVNRRITDEEIEAAIEAERRARWRRKG
jgi:bifunctional DNA-binding transcriptional regulator/antitoxin component of YhaV-PrlF toxin-antitoxin module